MSRDSKSCQSQPGDGAIPSHGHGRSGHVNPSRYQNHGTAYEHDDPYLPGNTNIQAQAHSSYPSGPEHTQCQDELFRTIHASIQMLYDVYDNNIGMIEELEKHETHGKVVENSGILSHITPVNKKRPVQDLYSGIELQLNCLHAQMVSLPFEITSQAKKTLVMQTIKWAASREAADIPYGNVDHYCKNVLEILLFGAPKELPNVDRGPKIRPTTEQGNEAVFQVARQRHLGEKQDKKFQEDPKKKAKLHSKRQAEDIRGGARRLSTHNLELAEALEKEGYVYDLFTKKC